MATAYRAVAAEACVTASMTIAIVGLGGLGMNGVIIAPLQGAAVHGVDINSQKFEDAKHWGATACAIVDFAGAGSTTAEAVVALYW